MAVYLTYHAEERCERRHISREEVIRECNNLPKIFGETTWDNGRFKVKLAGDGRDIVVITVHKTDIRFRDTRRKK